MRVWSFAKKLESIFLKNEYPKTLVEKKINEIKSRNFNPKTDKAQKIQEIRDNPTKNYNLTLSNIYEPRMPKHRTKNDQINPKDDA